MKISKKSERKIIEFRKQMKAIEKLPINLISEIRKDEKIGLKDAFEIIQKQWRKRYNERFPIRIKYC